MTINYRKIRKLLVALFVTGVSVAVLFVILLAVPAVDSWLCSKIEHQLSVSLGHKLTIEELQYYPLRTLSLRGIKLLDEDSTAIATASRIKASVDITSVFSSKLSLSQLDIDSLRLYVTQLSENPSLYNISKLTARDSISDLHPDDTLALYTAFGITSLRLRDAEVFYTPLNNPPHAIRALNAKVEDLDIASDAVGASVSRVYMQVDDYPSFFSGDVALQNDTLSVSEFRSYFGNSVANLNSLQIAGLSNLDSLMVSSAKISSITADIDLLSLDNLPDIPKASLSGFLSVDNNSILTKALDVSILEDNRFSIDGSISNWNDIERGNVELSLSKFHIVPQSILQYAGIQTSASVDSTLTPLSGELTLSGPSDNISVSAQFLSRTISLILDSHAHCISNDMLAVEGTFGTTYNPGQVSRLLLGGSTAVVDFSATLSSDPDQSVIQCKGVAPLLTFLDYPYQNVQLEYSKQKMSHSAMVNVSDHNGGLKVDARLYEVGQYPTLNLLLLADTLRLGKLGIMPQYPNSMVDCKISAAIEGSDIDNAEGSLVVYDLSLCALRDTVSFGQLNLTLLRQTAERNRTLSLKSDRLKATMEGHFAMRDLWTELQSQLYGVSPSLFSRPSRKAPSDSWMNFDLDYHDISALSQLVDTNLVVSGNGSLRANIDASDHSSDLALSMSQVSYGNQSFGGLSLNYSSVDGDTSVVEWSTKTTKLATLGNIGSFHNVDKLYGDKLVSHFEWVKRLGEPGGDISLQCDFSRDKGNVLSSSINLDSSFIVLGKRRWEIAESSCLITPNSLQVNNFAMMHKDRYLRINGQSSKSNPADTLTVSVNQFAISDVLSTSPEDKFSLDGDLSALVYLNDIYGNVIVNCKSSIDNLFVDGDNLEHMDIESAWRPENKNLDLHLAIVTHGRQCVDANGQLDLAHGNMFLNFDIDSLSIGFLNFYLDAAIDNMQGTTSGNLQLHGPLDDIKLNSRLCVHHSTFSVKQTVVDYIIDHNDSIILSPDRMEFKHLRFRDRYGKYGDFHGYIAHDMFSNLRMFIDFDVNDMLVLDTQEKHNPSYYGTVFGNGYFGVRGTTSLCRLLVKAHTVQNSVFYILPLTKSELGQTDYIRFSNRETVYDDSEENKKTDEFDLEKQQEGVEAQLEVEIRPDAKIYAIVDPRSDNMLEGRGQGKINVEMTREGALLMEGTYTMEQGVYNFNLQNIVNKKFDIRKGSTVMWNGDPYDAIVDLVATYKTRASLYDLVQGAADESVADLKKRVPINCNLFLTEHLLNPKIRFEIEIPSSQNFSQYTFDQYVNTDEEMNRQVFSLLLAGRFYATQEAQSNANNATGGASTSNYLGTTLSELMSNQFSNWISQNKYNVGMGVNYRPGDEVTNEEYEVAVQTGVLDNKIVLSGNIGYGRDVSSESNKEGSFIGDFDVEVKLNKSETLRAKAYTHSNNDVIYETSPTTQGIGISYQESFDTFRELLHKYFGWMRRKKETSPEEKSE